MEVHEHLEGQVKFLGLGVVVVVVVVIVDGVMIEVVEAAVGEVLAVVSGCMVFNESDATIASVPSWLFMTCVWCEFVSAITRISVV